MKRRIELFQHLRGMFALALWDVPRSRLILARDPLGKKPLYVRREPYRILFASEIKSLLQANDIPRQVDFRALQEYTLSAMCLPRSLFLKVSRKCVLGTIS